jgi:hypothetical protein
MGRAVFGILKRRLLNSASAKQNLLKASSEKLKLTSEIHEHLSACSNRTRVEADFGK